MDEDGREQIDLKEYVTDPDHRPADMRWLITGGENVVARETGGVLSLQPRRNWNGVENLTVTVIDPGDLRNQKILRITVRAGKRPAADDGYPSRSLR